MKICHIITDLDVGGAESMLFSLVSNSNMHTDFNHYIVSLKGDGIYGKKLMETGAPVYSLNMQRSVFGGFSVFKLLKVLKKIRPDILHTWLYHADVAGLVFGILFQKNMPIIWNLRCSDMDLTHYSYRTRLILWALVLLSHLPDAVIANSQSGKNYHIQKGYKPGLWKIIPNGFNTEKYKPDHANRDRFRTALGIKNSDVVIGMIARYDPMKDHNNFLSAANKLVKKISTVHFILVGRGINESNRELMREIRRNNLGAYIHLIEETDKVEKIIPGFDISTLSSMSEGFPNIIGESMACGVPCVCTDTGDSGILIGDTGKVVQRKNAEALANAWMSLIELSKEKRTDLGLKARQRILNYYTIQRIVEQYEQFYASIVKR